MSPEVVSIHADNELCARNFKTLPFTCMPCCQAKANVTCDSVTLTALSRRRNIRTAEATPLFRKMLWPFPGNHIGPNGIPYNTTAYNAGKRRIGSCCKDTDRFRILWVRVLFGSTQLTTNTEERSSRRLYKFPIFEKNSRFYS